VTTLGFYVLSQQLLFSLLLIPVVAFLERIKLPRVLAIFLVVVTLVGLMGLMAWQTSQQFVDLTNQLPTYKKTLQDKIHALKGASGQSLNQVSDAVKQLGKELVTATPGSPPANEARKTPAAAGSSPSRPLSVEVVPPTNPLGSAENVLGPLANAGVVIIFTVFMLIGREDLRNRFIRLAGGGRLNVMTQALDEASHRINRYLFLQLVVNVGYGVVIGTALHFIGIPNASLWGGALRFFASCRMLAHPWRR
jgi:predicted PurR-regulated permease PerM